MRKTFTAFAAATLAIGFAASDAQAGPILQGLGNNGITLNGITLNAMTSNALTDNGLRMNGISFNGLAGAGITGTVQGLTLPGGGATLPMLAR